MSKTYRKIITEWIEERRILNAIIKLESPVYTAVNVYGKINAKEHYVDAKNIILDTIREITDSLNNESSFGERLRFDEIFTKIEHLECVESINEFIMKPSNHTYVKMDGVDIVPDGNCLLYPGKIKIDIRIRQR